MPTAPSSEFHCHASFPNAFGANLVRSVMKFVGYDYKKENSHEWADEDFTDIQFADLTSA